MGIMFAISVYCGCIFNPLHYNNTNLMMMAVFIQVIVQLYRILPRNTVGMKLQENLDNHYWSMINNLNFFFFSSPSGCPIRALHCVCIHLPPSHPIPTILLCHSNPLDFFTASLNLLCGLCFPLLSGRSIFYLHCQVYLPSLWYTHF